ncbi:MAG: DUF2505 domain-containing protein [Myxococcales bacterium]
MTVSRRISFEYAADPDRVAALVLDPGFLRDRSAAAGDREIDIQLDEVDGGFRLTIARQRTIDLPHFVKGWVEPTHWATEKTYWRRQGKRWVAEFAVEVQGMPGRASGRSFLEPSSAGCRYESTFEVTAKVPVPFLGSRIETLLADGLAEQLLFNAARNAAALASGSEPTQRM